MEKTITVTRYWFVVGILCIGSSVIGGAAKIINLITGPSNTPECQIYLHADRTFDRAVCENGSVERMKGN